MAVRLTNTEQDLPILNLALSRLDKLERDFAEVKKQVNKHTGELAEINYTQTIKIFGQNDLTFTWTSATHTLSWAAGAILGNDGTTTIPIPAGSLTTEYNGTNLADSTTYALAWNKVHQVMSASQVLRDLNTNPENIILEITTGAGGSAGPVGGGGTHNGGWGGGGVLK